MSPPAESHRVVLEQHGSFYVLGLPNRLRHDESDALMGVYDHLKKKGGQHQILLDLRQTSFLDSHSLGQVARIGSLVREANGRLLCAGASPKLLELFGMTRLGEVLEVVDDFETARKQFEQNTPPAV